jgi:ABC-type sugar transport system ATPase subunit
VLTPNGGSISFFGETVSINSPSDARNLGVATVFQDLALCENLDVVENLWLGRELVAGGTLREAEMEQRSWSLLRELGAKITSLRTPVSSLSGGQRQIVAIARALIGEPNVMILDEPTAALGVAQSAEVLNLIERLRERGLGVILISHSIADVQAVADRIVVLRLGRTNGEFRGAEMTSEAIIAAITGAVDNAVTRREAARRPIRDARPDPTSPEVARVSWASDLLPDPGAAKTVASARFR